MDALAANNCDTPPRHTSEEVRLEALLHELHEQNLQAAAADPLTHHAVGQGPVPRPAERSEQWPHDELAQCLKRGEAGDPDSARRAAELFELVENFGEAQKWWNRAADLGDPDAIDYVNEILHG